MIKFSRRTDANRNLAQPGGRAKPQLRDPALKVSVLRWLLRKSAGNVAAGDRRG
jgi:hypothetical protein